MINKKMKKGLFDGFGWLTNIVKGEINFFSADKKGNSIFFVFLLWNCLINSIFFDKPLVCQKMQGWVGGKKLKE